MVACGSFGHKALIPYHRGLSNLCIFMCFIAFLFGILGSLSNMDNSDTVKSLNWFSTVSPTATIYLDNDKNKGGYTYDTTSYGGLYGALTEFSFKAAIAPLDESAAKTAFKEQYPVNPLKSWKEMLDAATKDEATMTAALAAATKSANAAAIGVATEGLADATARKAKDDKCNTASTGTVWWGSLAVISAAITAFFQLFRRSKNHDTHLGKDFCLLGGVCAFAFGISCYYTFKSCKDASQALDGVGQTGVKSEYVFGWGAGAQMVLVSFVVILLQTLITLFVPVGTEDQHAAAAAASSSSDKSKPASAKEEEPAAAAATSTSSKDNNAV